MKLSEKRTGEEMTINRLWELLDFSGNGIFNSLDIILIWCYSVMVITFYKVVIKSVHNKK